MKEFIIDCKGVSSVDEFWQRYLDATRPAGANAFGRNLDAFWDAVEGGGPGWPGECCLRFRNTRALANFRTAGGGSFLAALRRIARDARLTKIALT